MKTNRSARNSKEPHVSIIVLNWNSYDDTRECLLSLQGITYPNHDTIVVDNGSEDDSYKRLKSALGGKVEFIRNSHNAGFTGGNNVAIRSALARGSDYVLLLNNDTIVDPEFLRELVRYAEQHPDVGILGPKIYYYESPNTIWFAGGRFNWVKVGISSFGKDRSDSPQYDLVKEVGFVSGCAMLIKRAVIEKVGMLDEDFFNYAEDLDLCFRAKSMGFRIVVIPRSKVWHKISKGMGGTYSPSYLYFQSRNRLLVVKKNTCFPYVAYSTIAHLLFYLPGKLLAVLLHKRQKRQCSLALIRGFADFLTNKVGNRA